MMDLFSNFEPFECMLCLTYYSIRDAITKINFLSMHLSSGSGGGAEGLGPPLPLLKLVKKKKDGCHTVPQVLQVIGSPLRQISGSATAFIQI